MHAHSAGIANATTDKESTMRLIAKIGDFTCLLIAGIVIAFFVFDLHEIKAIGYTIVVFKWMFVIGIAYAITNVTEGLLVQSRHEDYESDVFTGWLACMVLTCVSAYVVFTFVQAGEEAKWANLPKGTLLLLALTLFSWFHTGFILHHKNRHIAHWIQAQQAAPPPLPPPAPAPALPPPAPAAHHGGWKVFLVGLLIVAGLLLAITYRGELAAWMQQAAFLSPGKDACFSYEYAGSGKSVRENAKTQTVSEYRTIPIECR